MWATRADEVEPDNADEATIIYICRLGWHGLLVVAVCRMGLASRTTPSKRETQNQANHEGSKACANSLFPIVIQVEIVQLSYLLNHWTPNV